MGYTYYNCTALLWSAGICAFPTHSQLLPEMNSVWDPVAGKAEVSSSVDISVAVATPNGLITPIVSNADQKTIPEIAAVFRVSSGLQCCLTCD